MFDRHLGRGRKHVSLLQNTDIFHREVFDNALRVFWRKEYWYILNLYLTRDALSGTLSSSNRIVTL